MKTEVETRATHTAGKLHAVPFGKDSTTGLPGETLYAEDSKRVAEIMFMRSRDPETHKANAERLAHCWNCHDELLEALKAALPQIERFHCTDPNGEICDNPVIEQARGAIARAEKEAQ